MAHVVIYKRGLDDVKDSYKSAFGAIVWELDFDLEFAKSKK